MTASTLPSQSDRIAMNRLRLILDEFLKLDNSMTVQKALTLLTIAETPNLLVREIAEKAGIPMKTVATHVEDYGPDGPWRSLKKKKPGLGVIEYPTDYNDRRRKPCNISPKGQLVINSLLDLLNR